ncbi:unnamed protein product [Microthlaspi erraticum]|uniref:Uncharacterized protein n=1 Tax=Microthlaspi erraticum TaxID=1685480 RepID=A0A6D2HU11_9BRAS|nr:unnamed protein product [Microthlaspi erraticum]
MLGLGSADGARVLKETDATMVDIPERGPPPGKPPDVTSSWASMVTGRWGSTEPGELGHGEVCCGEAASGISHWDRWRAGDYDWSGGVRGNEWAVEPVYYHEGLGSEFSDCRVDEEIA